jgi:hypothetical protein
MGDSVNGASDKPMKLTAACGARSFRRAVVEGTDAETFARDAIPDDEDEPVEADEQEDGQEPDEEDESRGRGGMARLVPGSSRGGSISCPVRLGRGPGRSTHRGRSCTTWFVMRSARWSSVSRLSPVEIERLRVLDRACGSAHFLVEAVRFLGQALHVPPGAHRCPTAFAVLGRRIEIYPSTTRRCGYECRTFSRSGDGSPTPTCAASPAIRVPRRSG